MKAPQIIHGPAVDEHRLEQILRAWERELGLPAIPIRACPYAGSTECFLIDTHVDFSRDFREYIEASLQEKDDRWRYVVYSKPSFVHSAFATLVS